MATDDIPFADTLAAMRDEYLDMAEGLVRDARSAWNTLRPNTLRSELSDFPPVVALDVLRTPVHRLAGSAGTFGFPALSETANAIEALIVAARRNEGTSICDPAWIAAMDAALHALETAASKTRMDMAIRTTP